MRAVRSAAAVVGGLVVLLAIGCGQSPKDQQIEAYQIEVNKLQAEKNDLMARLAQALSDRDRARGRELDLQQRLLELQAEMTRREGEAQQIGRWTEAGGIAWTDIADNILFDSGKANLKAAGRTELQQVAAEIRERYAGRQIWIIGHTDNDPIRKSGWKDNLELSAQRACTVFREMQKLGFDPSRMVAAGQGEHNPKAENKGKTKRLNRRVQIIAVEIPDTRGGLEEASEQG